MPDFNELMRQAQVAQQQVTLAMWPYWLLGFLFWAASTALGVYVAKHFVALIKSVKSFIDAKTDQIGTSTISPRSFSRTPEIRQDDDLKNRPRM